MYRSVRMATIVPMPILPSQPSAGPTSSVALNEILDRSVEALEIVEQLLDSLERKLPLLQFVDHVLSPAEADVHTVQPQAFRALEPDVQNAVRLSPE
jgi:hypothetical protein